ncbi:MAG: Ig-like domain repeat protein [Rudaea sp.]|uniref:DUF7933 domain-containing protein n=1 Tax=Rudaea sp. TaxID=2136325 RepID=UPI0039E67029
MALASRQRRAARRFACCGLLLAASSAAVAQRAYVTGQPVVAYDVSGATPAPLGNIDSVYLVADLAVAPDGSRLYAVGAQANAGYLLVLDPDATDANPNPPQAVLGKVAIGSAPFGGMALSPDGKTAYVANFGEGSVYIVDVGSSTAPQVTADVSLCEGASGVALSADGSVLYVACRNANAIGIVGTAGPSVTTIPVAASPDQIALSADGNTLYINNTGTTQILAMNSGGTTTASVPTGPESLAAAPSGSTVYASLFRGMNTIGGFVAIDFSKTPAAVGTPIDVGPNPFGVTLSADGSTAYVVNTDPVSGATHGSVSVVDLASFKVTATLAAGAYPSRIAIGAAPPPRAPSATSLSLDANGGVIGQMVTASVVVTSPTASLGGPSVPPTGTVLVSEGTSSCTATLDAPAARRNSGSCSLPISDCGAATCNVTATYSGDTVYDPSDATAIPISVGVVGATLSPDAATIPKGASDVVTATLSNATATAATIDQLTIEIPTEVMSAGGAFEYVGNTCGSASTLAGDLILTGGSIPASGSCTVTFYATAGIGGPYSFIIDENDLQTSAGNNVTESDSDLTVVAPVPPTVAAAFAPSTIAAGGTSTLTLTLANANATPLLLAGLTDTLPAGLVVANPSAATTNCPDAAVTAAPGGSSIDVSNASSGSVTSTIPADGSCTASVAVTAAAAGSYIDTIAAGALHTQTTSPPDSSIIGGEDDNTVAASATLLVNPAPLLASTTTLAAAPNPAIVGKPVTFNVSVDPSSAPAPTGTVVVSAGALNCTAALAAASATTSTGACAITFAGSGSYSVTATYSGDGIYAASNATLDLAVNAASVGSASPAPALGAFATLLLALLLALAGLRRRAWPKISRP